jgi:transposase
MYVLKEDGKSAQSNK